MLPSPVLMVIDLQSGLVSPPSEEGPRSTPDLVSNVETILSTWRRRKWPVIHINHDDLDPDHPLHKDKHPDLFAPHACSAPVNDEPVLYKHLGSAFVDRELDLENRLTQLGGKEAGVVMIGMDGSQCINDNARAANDLGFQVVVVADACASFGMPDWRDGKRMISAEDTHVAAMSMLANGFAKVVSLDELLRLYGEA